MNSFDPSLIHVFIFISLLLVAGGLGALLHHLSVSENASTSQPRPLPRVAASPAISSDAPSNAVRDVYRTLDGLQDYTFSFERQSDGNWRVYITTQPGYNGRSSDAHTTHRLSSGDRKYICWSDPITGLEMAKQIAASWADATQAYIKTGTRF